VKHPRGLAYHIIGVSLSLVSIYSYSQAQSLAASNMQDKSFEIFIAIIGLLLSICGFLAVFILNSMWTTQKQIYEKVMTAFTRIELIEQMMKTTQKDLEENREQIQKAQDNITNLCKKDECPYRSGKVR
jgi:hypothetical protein